MDLKIEIAKSYQQIEAIRLLLSEYAQMRNHDSALGDYKRELENLPGKYATPKGALLIAYFNNQPAGCVAFQSFSESICEMKRMYVKPQFQGNKIGHQLIKELLIQAKKSGYHKMYLDTHPWMKAAQHLYQKFGFQEIERYNDNPTVGIRFFELKL